MICVHTLKYKFLLSTVQENKCNTNLLISQRKYGFLIKLCTHFYIYVWVHSILVHQQIDVAIDPVSFYFFTPWCGIKAVNSNVSNRIILTCLAWFQLWQESVLYCSKEIVSNAFCTIVKKEWAIWATKSVLLLTLEVADFIPLTERGIASCRHS